MKKIQYVFVATTIILSSCGPDIASIVREELEKAKEDKVVVIQQPPVTNTNEIVNNPNISPVIKPENVNQNDQVQDNKQATSTEQTQNAQQKNEQSSTNTSTNTNVNIPVSSSNSTSSSESIANSTSEANSSASSESSENSTPTTTTDTPSPTTPISTPEPTPTPQATSAPESEAELKVKWTKVNIPVPNFSRIYSVDCTSKTECWGVGSLGAIRHTTNSGGFWTETTKGDKELRSVNFVDSNYGWISGENGTLYKTSNGSSWQVVDSTVTGGYIYAVGFGSQSQGIFVHGGVSTSAIYETRDSGQSFTKKYDLNFVNDASIKFFTPTKAIIVTVGGGGVYLYDDGLISLLSPTATVPVFKDSKVGWLHTLGLWKTTNGGQSFQEVDKVLTDDEVLNPPNITAMSFLNNDGWFIRNNKMYSTSDGGDNWSGTSNTAPFLIARYFELFGDVSQGWAFVDNEDSTKSLWKLSPQS